MSVMRIPLTITYIDGRTEDVEALPLELVKFERQYNLPMTVFASGQGRRMEYQLFLGYAALSREADIGTFDDWMATVGNIDLALEEPEGSDPLDQSPSTGS